MLKWWRDRLIRSKEFMAFTDLRLLKCLWVLLGCMVPATMFSMKWVFWMCFGFIFVCFIIKGSGDCNSAKFGFWCWIRAEILPIGSEFDSADPLEARKAISSAFSVQFLVSRYRLTLLPLTSWCLEFMTILVYLLRIASAPLYCPISLLKTFSFPTTKSSKPTTPCWYWPV